MNPKMNETNSAQVSNESTESALALEVRRSRKVRTGVRAGKDVPFKGLTFTGM